MAISIKLEAFEGPLDLLLYLIDKDKINIYDIPIGSITDQYMEYVAQMQREDLDTVSEFLVMAAELLDIKARMLLPAEKDEDGEEEDPREDLVARLLEHKLYKEMASEFSDMSTQAGHLYYHNPDIPKQADAYREPADPAKLLKGVDMELLMKTFRNVMKRAEDKIDPVRSKFGTIRREPVKVSDRMKHVLSRCKQKSNFSFDSLLDEAHDKMDVVVTFLAVLELIKMGQIRLSQEELFGRIDIEAVEDAPELTDVQLESMDN